MEYHTIVPNDLLQLVWYEGQEIINPEIKFNKSLSHIWLEEKYGIINLDINYPGLCDFYPNGKVK